MAENSAQERTEQPTGKRLEESRKKGQIARSRELNTFAVLMAGSAGLVWFGTRMATGLTDIMRREFQLERDTIFDPHAPLLHLQRVLAESLLLMAPLLGLTVVAALLGAMALGGWSFSTESLMPKAERFNPIRWLGRTFSLYGAVELIKSLIKVALVSVVAWVLFKRRFDEIVGLGDEELIPAIFHSSDLLIGIFLYLSASLAFIVVIDVPYQLWDYQRNLKMTKQEVRDEAKETEGRPEVKGRIRRLQMEMAQRRMMEEVPKADVVITNPTHFAVALKYDPDQNGAPVVVAKGGDLVAATIRNLATASQVPLVSAPPLARALFYSTDLNKAIPKELYLAVAQVLAYVYQLRAAREGGWQAPEPPKDLPVPDDLTGPPQ